MSFDKCNIVHRAKKVLITAMLYMIKQCAAAAIARPKFILPNRLG